MSDVYDEVSRNNAELNAIIEEKYEVLTMSMMVMEIAKLKKTIFVPSVLYSSMEQSSDSLINEAAKHNLVAAGLKALISGTIIEFGVLISVTEELVAQTAKVYSEAFAEAREATRH